MTLIEVLLHFWDVNGPVLTDTVKAVEAVEAGSQRIRIQSGDSPNNRRIAVLCILKASLAEAFIYIEDRN